MIKTKTAFLIFVILCIIIFPYHIAILFIHSDSLSSLIPGWHTTIFPGQIIANLIKFLILFLGTFFYWKLSKIIADLDLKKFLIHFFLTIPAIFVGRISLYELLDFNLAGAETLISRIQIVIYTNTFINILFFIGQILFWRFYTDLKTLKM